MSSNDIVNINPKTIASLNAMGIDAPNGKIAPDLIFSLVAVKP